MAWSTTLVALLALISALYLFGGSLILWASSLVLKNWRYTSRGFEWDRDPEAVIPTLLIRRISLNWGGRRAWKNGGTGLVVLRAAGISFRRGAKRDGPERSDAGGSVKVGLAQGIGTDVEPLELCHPAEDDHLAAHHESVAAPLLLASSAVSDPAV